MNTSNEPWASDTDFEDLPIEEVEKQSDGTYVIKQDGGLSFWLGETSIVPKKGDTVRFYPAATFASKRGVFINGQCVRYQTKADHDEAQEVDLYGKDAADWLARWDAGKSIWSVSMGGLGPGYEQCIQVLAVEVVRHWLTTGETWWNEDEESNQAKWKEVRKGVDAVVSRMDEQFGFSGAQVGAAINLAGHIYRKGPRCVKELEDGRRIQVSRDFPKYEPATSQQ